jgi:hypothetical protein
MIKMSGLVFSSAILRDRILAFSLLDEHRAFEPIGLHTGCADIKLAVVPSFIRKKPIFASTAATLTAS